MKKAIDILLRCLLGAVLTASCTVKEERTDCPCLLEIDLGLFRHLGSGTDLSVQGPSGTVHLRKTEEGLFRASVRKGTYAYSVVTTGRHTYVGSDRITVREGEPDSLYAAAGSIECAGERILLRPEPEKQFCTVSLRVVSSAAGTYLFPVRSACNGLFRFSLTPAEGAHTFLPAACDAEGTYRFRLSRQNGKEGPAIRASAPTGEIREIPLGDIMLQAGYDWTRRDLEDFFLEVDPILGAIRVHVSGWDAEQTLEIRI